MTQITIFSFNHTRAMKYYENFLQIIGRLKESSKHAVIDGSEYSLDDFKEYLHVERKVERDLKEKVIASSKLSKSQLILVCGNVGDGKSHVLSYLNQSLKKEISSFKIHNDATEAFNPDESFVETLSKVLNNFRDVNLGKFDDKVLLAINLGTLNNFLDEKGDEFTQLKEYVDRKGILKTDVIDKCDFEENSFFQYVNFTDYQLYSLTADGCVSDIVEQLLSKVVSQTPNNPIAVAYEKMRTYYSNYFCPVFFNYHFLSTADNRMYVSQLVIKSLIKSKEIISLRAILNFVYDIIIPIDYQQLSESEFLNKLQSQSSENLISNVLPNYLFIHPELSLLFQKIQLEDPCNFRSETTDDSIIRVINTNQLKGFIENNIQEKLLNEGVGSHIVNLSDNKVLLTQTYIRLFYISTPNYRADNAKPYCQYIEFLYHYNCKNVKQLRVLYNIVNGACKKWNGNPEKENRVIIDIGKKQNKYRILIPFKPKALPGKSAALQLERLDKFNSQLKVTYEKPDKSSIDLHIDYGLFNLMLRVNNGYRPNKLDIQSYVNFISFLSQLISLDVNTTLEIDEVNIGRNVDYEVSYDNAFGQDEYKFSII